MSEGKGGGAAGGKTFAIGGCPMFLRKTSGNNTKPEMEKKKITSQNSSAGLAVLPVQPTHGSVANSRKLSGHGRRSRPLWQVN